jgi:membrane fusion protein, multidrug efflux system
MSRAFALAAVFLVLSCSKTPVDPAGPGDGARVSTSADDAGPPGTPVKIARVVRATLPVTVSGPGRTDALEQQKVRAPFKGLLRQLRVADGDFIKKGQIVAVLVAQESESALTGARALLRSANTPQQKSDAQRALQLAERGLVATSLRAPADGVVVTHGADEGSLVAEAQDVVSLAATDSFVFVASIAQTEISQVRPGQPAQVVLPAHAGPITGKVHSILPGASPNDLNEPARIDLAQAPHALGLFGTATITVGERRDVSVVPDAAVLRDDVTGVRRVAVVEGGKLKWQTVRTGASAGGTVEIVDPPLTEGTQVVTDGQVGLPDGAPLQVVP